MLAHAQAITRNTPRMATVQRFLSVSKTSSAVRTSVFAASQGVYSCARNYLHAIERTTAHGSAYSRVYSTTCTTNIVDSSAL